MYMYTSSNTCYIRSPESINDFPQYKHISTYTIRSLSAILIYSKSINFHVRVCRCRKIFRPLIPWLIPTIATKVSVPKKTY